MIFQSFIQRGNKVLDFHVEALGEQCKDIHFG